MYLLRLRVAFVPSVSWSEGLAIKRLGRASAQPCRSAKPSQASIELRYVGVVTDRYFPLSFILENCESVITANSRTGGVIRWLGECCIAWRGNPSRWCPYD